MSHVQYEPVIGLECHVQLSTETKAFSGASARYGGAPNEHTDPYTLALPGTLPVLTHAAVDAALALSLAAGCAIRRVSRFARKHYFYPDLPKGYQITQYEEPIAEGGRIDYVLDGQLRAVRLIRIHMEEDAGKSVHVAGQPTSLVDLNRAGVPLVEVVSEPCLYSSDEAAEYLKALRQLVRHLGVCDGNMEEGSLRCDANVSIRPVGSDKLGTRTELKNLNSFKHVKAAIDYEIARQTAILRAGGVVTQETRLWDPDRGTSHTLRTKEDAQDYRYFPEPDLPPLVIDDARYQRVAATLPELPIARRTRYMAELGLSAYDADLLSAERDVAEYYDAVVAAGADAKKAANWMATELLGELKRDERAIAASPIGPAALAELIGLVEQSVISGKIAKDVFQRLYAGEPRSPRALVEAEGLAQVTDESAIEAACRRAVAASPKQVEKYRAGNANILGYFVGQVMKESGGKANPEATSRLLKKILAE